MASNDPSLLDAARAIIEGKSHHDLLEQALRHKSAPGPSLMGYMATLGMAALKFSLVWTYVRWSDYRDAGRITNMWASFVTAHGPLVTEFADEVVEAVHFGKGVNDVSPVVRREVVLALIGAAYYSDFDAAHELCLKLFYGHFANSGGGGSMNPKSQLQSWSHQRKKVAPTYRVISETGPDHDKRFVVEATVRGTDAFGRGEGTTKKIAETEAAKQVLAQFGLSSSSSARRRATQGAFESINRPWSLDNWVSGVARTKTGFQKVPPLVKQISQEVDLHVDARLVDIATAHISLREKAHGKLFGAGETGLEILGNTAYNLALIFNAEANCGLEYFCEKSSLGALTELHARLEDNAFKREFGRRWVSGFRTGENLNVQLSDAVLSNYFEGLLGAICLESVDGYAAVEDFIGELLIDRVDYGTMTVKVSARLAKKTSHSVLQQLIQLVPTQDEQPPLTERFRFRNMGPEHAADFHCTPVPGDGKKYTGRGDTKTASIADCSEKLLRDMAPRLTDDSKPKTGIKWADECIDRLRHEIFDKRNRSLITRLVGYKKLQPYSHDVATLLATPRTSGKAKPLLKPAPRTTVERAPARRPAVQPTPPEFEPVYELEVELAEIPVAGLLSELTAADGFDVAFLGFSGPGAGFALAEDTPCVHCHAPTLVTLLELLAKKGDGKSRATQISARIQQGELELIIPSNGTGPNDGGWKQAEALADSLSAQLIKRSADELVLNLPLVLDSIDHFAPSDLDELL